MSRTLAQWPPVRLARDCLRRFVEDDIDTHAAALAYQVFLSTLALSIGGLAILGMVANVVDVQVPTGAEEQYHNLTEGGPALAIASLLGLLWTSSTFGRRAAHAFAVIFRTGPVSMAGGRVRGLFVALGVIVLVGALPVLTAMLTWLNAFGLLETEVRLLGLTATLALDLALFLTAYVALTPHGPGWRAHLPGAIAMTVGWEVFKIIGELVVGYLVNKSTLLYGAIGSTVALLILLRMTTWLLLFGAELSAVLAERRAGSERST